MNDNKLRKHKLSDWLDNRQARGIYNFIREEALKELEMSKVSFDRALGRFSKKKRLVSVFKGFYLIIPIEYKSWGVLPVDWFISDLMTYLKQPYYAGLLTAADYYGASHQKSQVYQVVTDKALRPVICERIKIKFFVKKDITLTPVEKRNSQTGIINISTPEATALDLLRYQNKAVGLNHTLTVLQELGASIDQKNLVDTAKLDACAAYAQRLGWLLEKTEYGAKTSQLAEWVKKQNPVFTKLDPKLPMKGTEKNDRWRLWINTAVEGDL